MAFKFVLSTDALQDIKRLDEQAAKRIVEKLSWFERQTDPLIFAKRLREPAAGDIRFRIGEYRAIALLNTRRKQIEIIKIGHRREIYTTF